MYKILVVDDNESVRKFLSVHLKQIDCDVITTAGISAISKAINFIPDLVLIDVEMQGVRSFDVLRELRSYEMFKDTPVIMTSAHAEKTTIVSAFKSGANDFILKSGGDMSLKPFDIGILFSKIISWQNSEIETQWSGLPYNQEKALRLLKVTMEEAFEDVRKSAPLSSPTIRSACEILHFAVETEGADAILKAVAGYNTTLFLHSLLMCVYMLLFTRYMGYSKNDVVDMSMGGLIHDVGIVKIPNNILFKPGKLDAREYNEIKLHVKYSLEALDRTPGITPVMRNICQHHHERLDGSGYEGLKADKISPEARLAAIIETFCAITTKTVYREPKTAAEAIASMMSMTTQLDPQMLKEFKEASANKFKVKAS
ncbi:MAG: response regulator [Candidatus Magnetominusculus sp. LBB02]|nr:response regulator [Candidatus Magnetominusculus sp. LBB02]